MDDSCVTSHDENVKPGELRSASDAGPREVEERQCRYCLGTSSEHDGELISPCACKGGQQWVHLECLRRWQRSVLVAQPTHPSLYEEDRRMTHCGVCTQRFSLAMPSRHEMMMGFTGIELCALVQELSLICASEDFSSEIRAQLQAVTYRRSISNFAYWHRGVYFIYYAGPRQLALTVPDEANRSAVLSSLEPGGTLRVQGRRYQFASEGAFAAVRRSSPLHFNSGAGVQGRRGAAWVFSRVYGSRNTSASASSPPDVATNVTADVAQLREILLTLPLPADVTLEAISSDTSDVGDDTIRAVNIANRIDKNDLSAEAQAIVRNSWRAARLRGTQKNQIELQHHLGGPCSPSRCVVFLPIGGCDGVTPPLPLGFRALGQLGVAVGTNLPSAMSALAAAREADTQLPLMKKAKTESSKVSASQSETDKSNLVGLERHCGEFDEKAEEGIQADTGRESQKHARDHVRKDQEECKEHRDDAPASAGSTHGENDLSDDELVGISNEDSDDISGVGAGEFALSPPADDDSCESDDDSDRCDRSNVDHVQSFSEGGMVAGVAASSLMSSVLTASSRAANNETGMAEDRGRPLLVFWGEARWQRTQLLGELARGDWGLCHASDEDLIGSQELWEKIVLVAKRPVYAPQSEMRREVAFEHSAARSVLGRLVAAHQEATRQQQQQ